MADGRFELSTKGVPVEMNVEDSHVEIEIPDVTKAALSDLTAEEFSYDDLEQEEEVEEEASEEEEGDESTEGEEEAEQLLEEQGNLYARNRVLRREKQEKDIQIESLSSELASMRQVFEQIREAALAAARERENLGQAEEEEDDPMDPMGSVLRQMTKISNEIKELKNEKKVEKVQTVEDRAIGDINVQIHQARTQYSDFNEAFSHLAGILKNNAHRKMPDAPERERIAAVAQYVRDMKLDWARRGLNPVEELYSMAVDYGFKPPQSGTRGSRQPSRADAEKRSVEQGIARRSSMASLGKTQGTSPKRVSPKVWKNIDGSTFNRSVQRLVEAGVAHPQNTIGRTPSFADLLPGKGIAKE